MTADEHRVRLRCCMQWMVHRYRLPAYTAGLPSDETDVAATKLTMAVCARGASPFRSIFLSRTFSA